MIVFGKRRDSRSGLEMMHEVASDLTAALAPKRCEGCPDRREAVLLGIASLAQGLLDLEYESRGAEQNSLLGRSCGTLMRCAGDFFVCGSRSEQVRAPLLAALAALQKLILEQPELQQPLKIREPEGFAFYSLLPEQYVESARRLATTLVRDGPSRGRPSGLVQIIGLRSIGTALASVTAAALQTSLPIWTVRPSGHPFAREVRIAESLRRALIEDASRKTFVVVDEGPGLSGSSFLAVTSWLERHGVDAEQIWLIPSHGGMPGFVAKDQTRAQYMRTQRAHVSFEELCLQPGSPASLRDLFSDVVGPAERSLSDASAGRWRAQLFCDESSYPVSHPQQERRKYLLEAGGRRWLLKFEGLGARGAKAHARASALHEHGFAPQVLALRKGFSLTRWFEDARPLSLGSADRPRLVDQVAAYISFVVRRFGSMPPASGARPAELVLMLQHNAHELLAPELSSLTCKLHEWLPELELLHRTTATDNRMEAHEWILLGDGRMLKTDALNHHAAHDCIGCQDPAWDIVGACFELDFTEHERERLHGHLARQSLWPTAHQWTFYELAYLAFKAGFHALAKTMLAPSFPGELPRVQAALERYKRGLTLKLAALACT